MTMKEKIDIRQYAEKITEALPRGILLNTNGDKFNSMVIGWGAVGTAPMANRDAHTMYIGQIMDAYIIR